MDVWIVLNDDGVLDVATRRRWCAVLIGVVVGRAGHSAAVQEDLESGAEMTGTGFHMHAVVVTVEALREDHSVEGTIELNVDTHVRLLALHLEVFDLWVVRCGSQRPC